MKFVIAGAIVSAGALVFLPSIRSLAKIHSNCERGNPDIAHVALVDQSQKMEATNVAGVEALLSGSVKKSFLKNNAVIVGAVTGKLNAPFRQVFHQCVPKRGKNANVLFQTPQKIDERFELSFGYEYVQSLKYAVSPEYPRTPLIQSVNAAYESAALRYPDSKIIMHIVSDGLHNLPDATAYGSTRSRSYLFQPETVERLKQQIPAMPNTELNFHIIERFGHKDRRGNDMFSRQRQLYPLLQELYGISGAKVSVRPL